MNQPRRRRYYGYKRRDGSVAWVDKQTHDYLQRYPKQVPYFQFVGYTGVGRLMSAEQRAGANRRPVWAGRVEACCRS